MSIMNRWLFPVAIVIVGLCILASVVDAHPVNNSTTNAFKLFEYEDTDDNNAEIGRIVGGSQAAVGEYPYFVQTRNGGCGGILIASEWVLTAVHCSDITGQEVIVGAYRTRNTDYGAKRRTCTTFKRHPNFVYSGGTIDSPNAPFTNDFALCKLSTPVYVDDTTVTLKLNNRNNWPAVGQDVVAAGFGTTSSGGSQPEFLRDVTVEVNSNWYCGNAPSSIYNTNNIGIGIICASVPGGGKDACQGDSGGPLVRKEYDNGKRVDWHVGVTSWGIGCATSSYPGVYSRTSSGYSWIRRVICTDGNSPHPFCGGAVQACSSNQEQLIIKLVTDGYPSEISWTLTETGRVIRAKNNYGKQYFTYEEYICLAKGSIFEFNINDAFGDGLSGAEGGFYTLTLNGQEIRRGSNYGENDTKEIRTQVVPTRAPVRPPTRSPTKRPTRSPTERPTRAPTQAPVRKTPKNRKRNKGENSRACRDVPGYYFKFFQHRTCEDLFRGKRTRSEWQPVCDKVDTRRDDKTVAEFCKSYCSRRCRANKRDQRILQVRLVSENDTLGDNE